MASPLDKIYGERLDARQRRRFAEAGIAVPAGIRRGEEIEVPAGLIADLLAEIHALRGSKRESESDDTQAAPSEPRIRRNDGTMAAGRWFAVGQVVMEALRLVPQKRRGSILKRLSLEHGVHQASLRRAAKAAKFLESLRQSEAGLAEILKRRPFQAVELIERWNGIDEAGALEAARRLAKKRYAVTTIQADYTRAASSLRAAKGIKI